MAADSRRPWPLIVVGVVVVLVTGALAFSAGRLSVASAQTPSETSAEAGFARDMQVHHQQGVELAMIVRDRTADAATRTLAYDIATTQAQQAGQLFGWLVQWKLPQAGSEPEMTWMTRPATVGAAAGGGHSHGASGAGHRPGDPMPGLATPAQIAQLRAATGVDAERRFLTLMIAHHEGAVEMAEAVLARSENPSVRTFADAVVKSQESEITLMRGMLAERS
ncbi:DUF305 domain-containing protein [Leifsonia sp. NPDC080035]|uniref:DUF305 domain-containing protein n=1 Tax=Leifsonia sp. NPDC080035 TaxID=3143936 RepID=A0AAU7G8A6_9MICO